MLLLRVAALTALWFICSAAVAAAVLQPVVGSAPPSDAAGAAGALLAVSFLSAIVLSYVVLRSRWSGWKLVATIFVVLYGVGTVLPQIETAVFVTRLPAGMLPRLFVAGAITSALVAPLAVLVLGRARARDASADDVSRLDMRPGEWTAKLALVAVLYVLVYFTFGYFIAWRSAEVRAYYGGTDPGSFVAQLGSVVRDTPWLVPLQVARGLLWAAIAVPVVRMMRGPWWEAALAVALAFAVLTSAQLLLPNPLMPRAVRMAHLLETSTSNFLFGWLTVAILCWPLPASRSGAA
ncbi:MAG TPA: hypothetical protein VL328_15785 [Gemmatimonadaceae bacterium]|nr:hypothetical protein [Gemmatimonadaceae bacterium]